MQREGLRRGRWGGECGEDVITTVAELSPRSVVSLSSVQREASKIIPPIVLTNSKWRASPKIVSHIHYCVKGNANGLTFRGVDPALCARRAL